jgi:hypothetical protein
MRTNSCFLCPAILAFFIPKFFQFYTEAISQAVDKGVVAGDLVDVQDGRIVEPSLSQSLHICFQHVPRPYGQLLSIIQHRPVGVADGGLPPIVYELLHQVVVIC